MQILAIFKNHTNPFSMNKESLTIEPLINIVGPEKEKH